MTTYLFTGSNLTVQNFDPANDTVVIDGVDVADVASFEQTNTSVILRLTSGQSLTLQGVIFASLNNSNFQVGSDSDLEIFVGDNLDNTASANLAVGLDGDDHFDTGTDDALYYGNQGDDTLHGNGYENLRLYGGQGDDTITGAGNGSVVYGGLGFDTINVSATEGIVVYGGNGQLDAADDGDLISGGTGDDVIYGNGGDDVVFSGGGADTIYGGAGDDTISLGAAVSGDTVVVYGGLGEDAITAAGVGADAEVVIYGGNGQADAADDADAITGSAGDDVIYGNGGDDVIASNGGADIIYGGQGDDTVAGAVTDGAVVYGGLGEDNVSITVTAADDAAVIYGGNGLVDAADAADTFVLAGAGDAVVYGNGGDDVFGDNGDGDSSLFGGAGDDTFFINNAAATASNKLIVGGIGSDTIDFSAGTSSPTLEDIDTVQGFNFDEDEIRFDVATTAAVSQTVDGTNLNSLADLAAINNIAGVATVITVNGGAFEGVYLDQGAELVRLIGSTGTVDLDAFA